MMVEQSLKQDHPDRGAQVSLRVLPPFQRECPDRLRLTLNIIFDPQNRLPTRIALPLRRWFAGQESFGGSNQTPNFDFRRHWLPATATPHRLQPFSDVPTQPDAVVHDCLIGTRGGITTKMTTSFLCVLGVSSAAGGEQSPPRDQAHPFPSATNI